VPLPPLVWRTSRALTLLISRSRSALSRRPLPFERRCASSAGAAATSAATLGGRSPNNDLTGTFLAPTTPLNNPTFNVANTLPINFGSNGFLVGGQGRCNLEFTNRWVIGFEVDAAWANASGSSQQTLRGSVPGPLLVNTSGIVTTKTDFIATATARLGYAFGSTGQELIYGKGGAAWIANRDSFTGQLLTSANFIALFNWTSRETRTGWTIGAGVEWAMVGNWTIKGNYLDFGTRTVTLNDSVLGPTSVSFRQTVNEVKFVVNYRFAAPLQYY
jgi:outer membrane immunogenic protein